MLRVGILMDRPDCPVWFGAMIEAAADTAAFFRVVVPYRRTSGTMASRLLTTALLLDGLRTSANADAMRSTPDLAKLPVLDETDARAASLDLMIAACDLEPSVLATWCERARFGLWKTMIGGEFSPRCPGVRGLDSANPVHGIDLVACSNDVNYLAARAEVRVHCSSLAENAASLLQPTKGLLRQALVRLDRNRDIGLAAFPLMPDTPVPADLSARQCLRLIAKTAYRTLLNRLNRPSRYQWGVGIDVKDRPVEWVKAHPYGFLADPFLIEHGGVRYVFVEEFVYDTSKGHISVCTLDHDNALSMPIKVLESDHHLSFPFVFKEEGRFYMIPEQCAGNSVVLYEATNFPYDWTFRRVLIEGFAGVDSVLHWANGRLWLFTSDGANGNQDNNLFLFSASNLLGTFEPHRKNPVKSGLRGSRMAGRILDRAGNLLRPSQNCTLRYGHSIVMNQIEELSDDDYVETEVEEIKPATGSPFPLGLHTFNALDGIDVIDGLRAIPASPRLARSRTPTSFLQAHRKQRSRRLATNSAPIKSGEGRP